MCVILVGNAGAIRSLDLKAAWGDNPHGAGIAYARKRLVVVDSGIMSLAELDCALGRLQNMPEPIAVHLRFATHGARNRQNTHPFKVGNSGHWLMHNGVLDGFGVSGEGGISDSRDLANTLSKLPRARDRQRILDNMQGMYAYIQPTTGISLHGSRTWQELQGVSVWGRPETVYASNVGFTIKPQTMGIFSRGTVWSD